MPDLAPVSPPQRRDMHRVLIAELKRAYDLLNQELFNGQLPVPAFSVNGAKRAVLYFDRDKFQITTGKRFATASVAEILDDLIHQMCHIHNHVERIKDQTGHEYHNKKFAATALRAGLIVTRTKREGCLTGRSPAVGRAIFPPQNIRQQKDSICERLEALLNKESLKIRKVDKKKAFFLKYVCGCPSPFNSIRSGRRPNGSHKLNAVCQDCGQPFRCVEGDDYEDRHGESAGGTQS